MIESCLATYGGKIIDYNIGTPVNVDFNFGKIWRSIKEINENHKPIVYYGQLHFIHVHPKGLLNYSELDRQVMKGYTLALGRNFLFTIIIFDNDNIFNIDHEKISFCYNKKDDCINQILDKGILEEKIIILKLLSYKLKDC